MKSKFVIAVSALLISGLWSGMQGQTGEPLFLDALRTLAEERNPGLRAASASELVALARVGEASTLPDPTFQLGIMNFGVPNLNADMPMSMAPSVQLAQMLPFPGKLSRRGEMADLGASMMTASVEEVRWELRRQVSALFYDLYSLDRQIEVMSETLELLTDFQLVAKAMYSSGAGRQADVLRSDVEVARMDGEIQSMRAMRIATAARLNGLLDRHPDTPVGSPALGSLPGTTPVPTVLREWARESRPLLRRGELAVDRAGVRSELAQREIWPNITLGLQYGQRDRGLGPERMGSVMVGFTLPVHAGSRQFAAREEADAMARLAEAELGGVMALVDARIGELLAELERARSLMTLYRNDVLPEARATVEAAFTSYRVGAVDFMTLVDAQMMVNRFEAELYQLIADYGEAVATLESTVGRPLPLTAPLLAEER